MVAAVNSAVNASDAARLGLVDVGERGRVVGTKNVGETCQQYGVH